MKKDKHPECAWFTCKEPATIRIPRLGPIKNAFCDEHYLLNTLRFGADLKGEPLSPKDNGQD